MSTVRDDAALAAAFGRTGARIKTTGSAPVSDSAGSYYLRGSFYVNTDSPESVRIELTDGAEGYVRFDIEHDGTTDLSSLGATKQNVTTPSGTVTITGEEYWESANGTIVNFALDVALPAPATAGDGTWSLSVDPYITAGATGEGVVFRYLVLDRKV